MTTDSTPLSRRSALRFGLGFGAFTALAACVQRADAQSYPFGETPDEAMSIAMKARKDLMDVPELVMHGKEKVAMLCYPGMTMLDLVGPQYFLNSMMGADVQLVAQSLEPVMGDTGFAIVPTQTMEECERDLDILFIPGGTGGTLEVMRNDAMLDFIRDRASRAKHVTSVCTGSMILGAAGLLEGKRATSHWAAHHLLKEFGAVPVDARVVMDGNVTTGAGVSAGLDFAIALLAQIRGRPYAAAIQLQAEYFPDPPLGITDDAQIDPAIAKPLHAIFAAVLHDMRNVARG